MNTKIILAAQLGRHIRHLRGQPNGIKHPTARYYSFKAMHFKVHRLASF